LILHEVPERVTLSTAEPSLPDLFDLEPPEPPEPDRLAVTQIPLIKDIEGFEPVDVTQQLEPVTHVGLAIDEAILSAGLFPSEPDGWECVPPEGCEPDGNSVSAKKAPTEPPTLPEPPGPDEAPPRYLADIPPAEPDGGQAVTAKPNDTGLFSLDGKVNVDDHHCRCGAYGCHSHRLHEGKWFCSSHRPWKEN
jgi:hypothetical protein